MPINITVPELGESVLEATVGRWLKKEGDRVAAGEPLVELETDKVNLDVGAAQDGLLASIAKQTGADVKIGEVLGVIEPTGDGQPATAPAAKAKAEESVEPQSETPPPAPEAQAATPVAKRLAETLGVDLSRVPGRGAGGRITKDDVMAFAEKSAPAGKPSADAQPAPTQASLAKTPSTAVSSALPAQPPIATSEARREERTPMSRRRRTIARRLVEVQQTAAMLTTFNEIDMGAVVEMRQRHKEEFTKRHGVGLGFMSFFVKASLVALKAFPLLNAEIQGEEIIVKHYYDIGIAVGASEGLVVPVLRDADRLSFAQIEQGVKDFAERAKNGSLTLDDLRGGTFTLTNGGVFGSLLSTPILNPPQVGILGMHKIEDRPVARDGQVIIRPMMYVALTYDHRLVDGREAVQFLVRVKELIEDPASMLLE